jgi:archaellum biogenesis ATPase FlaH
MLKYNDIREKFLDICIEAIDSWTENRVVLDDITKSAIAHEISGEIMDFLMQNFKEIDY